MSLELTWSSYHLVKINNLLLVFNYLTELNPTLDLCWLNVEFMVFRKPQTVSTAGLRSDRWPASAARLADAFPRYKKKTELMRSWFSLFACCNITLHHLVKPKLMIHFIWWNPNTHKHTIIIFLSLQTLNQTLNKVSYESAGFHGISVESHSQFDAVLQFCLRWSL